MIPIEGLFEAHITVRDVQRSIAFYRDVVGLELGIDSSGSTRPTTQSQSQVSFCLEALPRTPGGARPGR